MSKSKEHIKRELEYLHEYGNMILIHEAIKYKKIPKETENIIQGMSEVQTVSAAVHEIAHSKLHNYAKACLLYTSRCV